MDTERFHEVYREPSRDLPVLGAFDVVVCGGGPAGCAAACAAGRLGAKTLLIERTGSLGGAPVTQNVLPILSTNGVDFQGVWHEWARRLKQRDGIGGLVRDERESSLWYRGLVDPEMVKYVWDQLLEESGVAILHLCLVAGAIIEDGEVRGVLVETKSGRAAVRAGRVVDATGDGDVCAAAGVGWAQGVDGNPWTQAVSLNAWYGGGHPTIPAWRDVGNLRRHQAGLLRVLRVNPLDPFDLTRALREGRRTIWERLSELRANPGNEKLYIEGMADSPGVRASRRVKGLAQATADEAWNFRKHADGIARCSWEIDIHLADRPVGKGVEFTAPDYQARMRRARDGDWFDIRYGCLVADGVDNLLMAGRCLSADVIAQSSLRIQQTCMATGQAAGTAAAWSLRAGVAPRNLDPAVVVAQLAVDRDVEPAFPELFRDGTETDVKGQTGSGLASSPSSADLQTVDTGNIHALGETQNARRQR